MRGDLFLDTYLRMAADSAARPAADGRRAAKPKPRRLAARARPAEPIALLGCVITPQQRIEDGYVVVDGDAIAAVGSGRPEGVRAHETGGVILPGLIDLHGHPEFNVFAAWDPPQQFSNRYQWRESALYHQLVRDPQNLLLENPGDAIELQFAEIRALVGGVTALQGAGNTTVRAEALVRNVDGYVFGERHARSMIDLPYSLSGRDGERLAGYLKDIADGKVTVLYVHLAEGRPDDKRSRAEFARLAALGALTPATVLIHGTALTADEFDRLAHEGRGLVWSPQSNLRLYGTTTDAATALRAGVRVGLGADWLPSGSASLLAEMKVARRELAATGYVIEPVDLVRMVTDRAAEIAGVDTKLGTIAEGRPADLVVLERHLDDPWENVCVAEPSWVDLVLIDGDLAYGRADWMTALAAEPKRPTLEPLVAWGKPMVLDASYQDRHTEHPPLTLAELRAALIAQYPRIGPIFA
jgi:cytosine/adenosine deaminase-related metal-dependent hydrolase